MDAGLPGALRAGVERELAGASRRDLADRAARTSAAYRAGAGSGGVIGSADDALAYALVRLPATYAACRAVFEAAVSAAPGFAPASLLDAGVGTGAASWAALEVWPEIVRAAWLDANPHFLRIAQRLAAEGPDPLAAAEVERADLTGLGAVAPADLVMASYALAEIAQDRQEKVVLDLWGACTGLLALVEPGTPAGFGRILAARTALIASGARIIAPCPGDGPCPVAAPDWCHFVQRLPRSRDHRTAKGAEAPFEDEKYSYLLAARPAVAANPGSRVLAQPRAGKPGIELKLCTPQGLERRFAARRDKSAYAVARRLYWGDRVETT